MHKFNKKTFIWLAVQVFALFYSVSCQKDLVYNFGEVERKLVFYPYIIEKQAIMIKLGSSQSLTDTNILILQNAKIFVYDNDNPIDTISPDANGIGFSDFIAQQDHLYRFVATATGYPDAECSEKLPIPVKQIKVDTATVDIPYGYIQGSEKYLKITTSIYDNGDVNDFYKFAFRQEYKDESIELVDNEYVWGYKQVHSRPIVLFNHPYIEFYLSNNNTYYTTQLQQSILGNDSYTIKLDNKEYLQGFEFYFSDKLFQGSMAEFSVLVRQSDLRYLITSVNSKDYLFLTEVSTMNKDQYVGIKSQGAYWVNKKNDLPFGSEVPIFSSVKGGYGFPVAITVKADSTILKGW